MKKLRFFVVLIIAFSLIAGACSKGKNTENGADAKIGQKTESGTEKKGEAKKIKVVTTLFPSYDFAKHIAGEKAEVVNIVPAGIEPHDYEPSPQDIKSINDCDIFIYTNEIMEPWAENVISSMTGKTLVVKATEGLNMENTGDEDADHDHDHEHDAAKDAEHDHDHDHDAAKDAEHDHDHDHDAAKDADHDHDHEDHHHNHGGLDPHLWTSMPNAIVMANNIEKALEKVEPSSKPDFEKNLKTLTEQLNEVDKEYKELAKNAKHKHFIFIGHFAFNYLLKDLGLDYTVSHETFGHESEPNPKLVSEIMNEIKNEGIKYVFYEEMSDPKLGKAIEEQTGVKLLPLNSAHNMTKEDYDKNRTFVDVQKENIENLKLGLN